MQRRIKVGYFCFILGAILLVASCRRNQQGGWNTELLLPIANTTLSLQNLVNDTSLVKTASDNSLILSYNSTLYQFNLADTAVNIPDTGVGQNFLLDSLSLHNEHINYSITLGTLANNMANSTDPTNQLYGTILLGANGRNSSVPAINGVNVGTFPFDADQFFDSAILVTGQIQVWVVNHFPVDISGALLTLKDSVSGNVITSYTMPYDTANDSVYFVIPLDGKFITSHLLLTVTNLSSPGTPPGTEVYIDTNDYVEMKLFVFGLHPSQAWAKFPAQNVLDETEEVTQNIRDRKLTFVNARSGDLHVHISSTVQEYLYLAYYLVGAYDNNGHPLILNTTVPPAQPNKASVIDSIISLKDYSINLTGINGTEFNTYTQRIVARIDSSGFTRHISLTDGVFIRYDIDSIEPGYVKGYMGRDTIQATDTSSFNFLNIFKGGTLNLANVTMNFSVQNGLGVDGVVEIKSLQGFNTNTGATSNLGGKILNTPLTVNRATDFPLKPALNNFAINNGNTQSASISNFLSILPNKIKYNVQINTNVNGNNGQYRDFAYYESGLNINLNAQVPLSLLASNLLLVDTIPFNLSNTNTNVNGITDGIINLVAENTYPVQTTVTVTVYDSTWAPVDTLVLNGLVNAANLDANCKVDVPKQTVIPVTINQARMTNLKRGRKAIISAGFSTSSSATCNGQYLTIYSNYNIGLTFTAKFNYKVNANF